MAWKTRQNIFHGVENPDGWRLLRKPDGKMLHCKD